ncbi:hypothetical protein [Streptomyces chrestomyceticus]|uniref:hypothetical protein n=1 Tax=Streptomyces chrestomyceticus TaxID=68185 RepID=UPI0033D57DB4
MLVRLALLHPEVAMVWADAACAKNQLVPWAKNYLDITVKQYGARPESGVLSSCRAAGLWNGPGRGSCGPAGTAAITNGCLR